MDYRLTDNEAENIARKFAEAKGLGADAIPTLRKAALAVSPASVHGYTQYYINVANALDGAANALDRK